MAEEEEENLVLTGWESVGVNKMDGPLKLGRGSACTEGFSYNLSGPKGIKLKQVLKLFSPCYYNYIIILYYNIL
jgi:hypothetical protein